VEADQAADAEHGDKAEQHRGRRHSGDVKAEVDRPQHAAEDVVDDQGQQQQATPREEADSEYEVGGRQSFSTSA
jgi:hypothetical protein